MITRFEFDSISV